MPAPEIRTQRLLLRHWKESDLKPFAKMNKDPQVMKFFPSMLSSEKSNEKASRLRQELEEKTYGLWAVEVLGGPPFIGYVGLQDQNFPAPFTPCTEIGWRLAADQWGKGYATEAARAVLDYARTLELKEIVSFTSKINKPSIRVMEKLGMTCDPADDFRHTELPHSDPLSEHVLYRISLDPCS